MPKLPPMETMAEQWADYDATILAPLALQATDPQYIDSPCVSRESRRAFYAGAQAMLAMVKDLSDRYPEAEAAGKLDAIALEFRRFEQDLRNGRA